MAALFVGVAILIRLSPHFRHHYRTHPLQSSNEKGTASSRSSKFNTLDTANIPTLSKTTAEPGIQSFWTMPQKKKKTFSESLRLLPTPPARALSLSLSLSRSMKLSLLNPVARTLQSLHRCVRSTSAPRSCCPRAQPDHPVHTATSC